MRGAIVVLADLATGGPWWLVVASSGDGRLRFRVSEGFLTGVLAGVGFLFCSVDATLVLFAVLVGGTALETAAAKLVFLEFGWSRS